jgi:1,4-dihydroxy-6-naphthoate synthase
MEKGTPLTIGFSPCPNDTFMFEAMVNDKIDIEGLQLKVVMEDIETLNEKAFNGELDITKVSYAVYPQIAEKYVLLDAGSALGFGVGPLLISKETRNSKSEIRNLKIAIPGKHTTANFLFSIFFPDAHNKTEMIFSQIEGAVLSGAVDVGVIIHENRFTYEQKGLKKIYDLGELWENETHQPIPLGGIVVKRNLAEELQEKINRVLRRGVEYAIANPESSYDYVKAYAQEMDEEVRTKHIALYVNEFSVDLGKRGRNAVKTLFEKSGKLYGMTKNLFIKSAIGA